MEFHEKLQALRQSKGMTQEDLAQALFVSRAAVSKWESGRGCPGIDSLKAIAKFFSVTVDMLLSGEEILTIAEETQKRRDGQFRDLVFGLLDISAAMFFLLPFFSQTADGKPQAVSLPALSVTAPYVKAAYFLSVICIVFSGIATLALQKQAFLLAFPQAPHFADAQRPGRTAFYCQPPALCRRVSLSVACHQGIDFGEKAMIRRVSLLKRRVSCIF